MTSLKIDFGCGPNKKEGFVGVDIENLPGVDIVIDLNKSLPFDSDSIDEIYTSHCLEHLSEPIKTLEEFYRILKPGGKMELRLPHFTNHMAFNPFHKHYFCLIWMDHLDPTTDLGKMFPYYSKARFKILSKTIILHRSKLFFWQGTMERFINKNPEYQNFYERFFAFIFPIAEMRWILEKQRI